MLDETQLAKLDVVPTAYVFDYDRTLFDTNKFVGDVWEYVSRSVDSAELELLKKHEAMTRTQGFDLMSAVKNQLGVTLTPAMLPGNYLYTGVAELFETMTMREIPYGIMTFGAQENQLLKLALMGQSIDSKVIPPAVIVDHQRKAAYIEETYQKTQRGRVVPAALMGRLLIAKTIIVVDDKQSNLECTSEDVRGQLIANDLTTEGSLTIQEFHKKLLTS